MRRYWMLSLVAIATLLLDPLSRSWAADAVPAQAPAPNVPAAAPGSNPPQTQEPDVSFESVNEPHLRLGDTLKLQVSGATAAILKGELAKPEGVQTIKLLLDGVAMAGLARTIVSAADGKSLLLQFVLARDANDDANRGAWDALLKKQAHLAMTLPVSLAIGTALPVGVGPPDRLHFEIAAPVLSRAVLVLGMLVFALVFAIMIRWKRARCLLQDAETEEYSLGKAQMVFWGLLVFLAVAAILIITGDLERIPAQTLTLLGISAGTGLGSALMTRSKRADVEDKIKALAVEQQQLASAPAAAPPTPGVAAAPAVTRLQAVESEMTRLQTPSASRGFFSDIVSDGKGPSFHRVQVVIWTLLLGGVFVHAVAAAMSMPEFPESLLLLMGISNGTYLGLKVAEGA